MLTKPHKDKTPRSILRERKLWHDESKNTQTLGCEGCSFKPICGGLHVGAQKFDCFDFCCRSPESCDRVCRDNLSYVDRVREVGGFDLNNTPRNAAIFTPTLPKFIPILFHGNRLNGSVSLEVAALPLYRMFDRKSGRPRFESNAELCAAFGLAPGVSIILTGTDEDPPIERWWGYGQHQRKEIIRNLQSLGIRLVTTPNYSLFTNRPRTDDLHSMKRIALVHAEFLEAGMPSALHINGRTDKDFERWASFITARPEVSHIAYEFSTGTGWPSRRSHHAQWLIKLAENVGRPLGLIVRGGHQVWPALGKAYAELTILDTSVFMKTMMRRRAIGKGNASIQWRKNPTKRDEPLLDLFNHNYDKFGSWVRDIVSDDGQ